MATFAAICIRRYAIFDQSGKSLCLQAPLAEAHSKLLNELTGVFQLTYRSRNLFYKALQAISDTVVDVQIKNKSSILNEIQLLSEDESESMCLVQSPIRPSQLTQPIKVELAKEIRTTFSRQRYVCKACLPNTVMLTRQPQLSFLDKDLANMPVSERTCTICSDGE